LGWDQEALRQAGKSDERKVRMAARLRKDTTMSLKWIAEHLEMGSWTHVSNLLGAKRMTETLKRTDTCHAGIIVNHAKVSVADTS
jgi:hypothetical protein